MIRKTTLPIAVAIILGGIFGFVISCSSESKSNSETQVNENNVMANGLVA